MLQRIFYFNVFIIQSIVYAFYMDIVTYWKLVFDSINSADVRSLDIFYK